MELKLLKGRFAGGYTSVGSCWKRGEKKNCGFEVKNEAGERIPALNEIAARWPDGSIKWARHTFATEIAGEKITVNAVKEEKGKETVSVKAIPGGKRVETSGISLTIHEPGSDLMVRDVELKGKKRISAIKPVMRLERTKIEARAMTNTIMECPALILSSEIVSAEKDVCVVRFAGELHRDESIAPFFVWMTFGGDSNDIKFEYTFIYNGDADKDFIKGLGLQFDVGLTGPKYNHHIKIGTDRDIFHEEAMYIKCEHPRTTKGLAELQASGAFLYKDTDDEAGRYIKTVESRLPVWDRYILNQPNEESFVISKQTHRCCCEIKSMCGRRAPGAMMIGSENGSVMVGIKDFWQRSPSALEADGISADEAAVTAWFKSPYSDSLDFRHYDIKAYRMECNEGYEKADPLANGIAFTSECFVKLADDIGSDGEFNAFIQRTRKNAVYTAAPEYYYEHQAFGRWSLPKYDTESEKLMEAQMEAAIEFYKEEIENRGWYGLLDYGDFMHTYDYSRHKWFYDFGGWAWQNTELVPTYWLWLYFMRTGREDVYTLAEAMSRHTSETDMYHLGKYKGIGSRHNVRHWGCPCKEIRISMAGHHRPLYYLTGDRRIGDCMHDTADVEHSLVNVWHAYREVNGVNYLNVRTGPDWAALVSCWMTEYERTLDCRYRDKILNGIKALMKAPMGLGSGPHFALNPETCELKYIGEFTENIHLTVCMGGPEIWLEAIDAIDSEELKKLVIDYSELYCMTDEEREEKYGSLVNGKEFKMNCLTSIIGLAGATLSGNRDMAKKAWKALAESSPLHKSDAGFKAVDKLTETTEGKIIREVSWISTGYVCQWCLNTLLGLEWCPDSVCDASEFRG